VITFVTLSNGTRYAFVGDVVWQLEGITEREERPWITRRRADTNANANSENLLRIVALKERLPDLIIVPAHDIRAFAEMPKLSQAAGENRHQTRETPRSLWKRTTNHDELISCES